MSKVAAIGRVVLASVVLGVIALAFIGVATVFTIKNPSHNNSTIVNCCDSSAPTQVTSSSSRILNVTTVITSMLAVSVTNQSSVKSSSLQNVCYSGALPENSSSRVTSNISNSSQKYALIFNVTSEFQNGSWVGFIGTPLDFHSYTFYAYYPNSTTTFVQLEPQLFINVTENTQGGKLVEETSWANLGGLGGTLQWPPFSLSGSHTLSNGDVTMQFLFPCGNQETVYFEIIVTET